MSKNHRIDVARDDEAFGTDTAVYSDTDANIEAAGAEFDYRKKYENTPLVVIAGRPNVGKSTLFNRFLRKRRAITDPTPGVTRDPIEAQAIINGKPVRLMDTGGFKLTRSGDEKEDQMDELVIEKTQEALRRADKILLLLEASAPTAEDEEFIRFLRPYWGKLITAVNKTEGGRGEAEAYNYLSFGFPTLLCISAEHGDNIMPLAEEITKGLDFSRVCEAPADTAIRIALIGKPNTGKSTLSNYLTKTSASIVSEIAGTTRDVVEGEFFYKDRQFIIQDTAGIRRKTKVKEDIEYYSVVRAMKSLEHADIVFHLIDAEEGLTEQDKKIIVQATKRGLGVIFVLNKWDLVKGEKKFRDAEQHIKIMFGKMEYAPIVPVSAQKGSGIPDLLNTALELFDQLTKKVETSALNLALKDWLEAVPPPHGQRNSFTIKYMVQTSARPVEFLIFANKPDLVSESYLRYITNRIRKDLGFSSIPFLVRVKGSRVKWEDRVKTVTGFSIGEVEKITGIKAHVLRYWEQTQPFLRPQKDEQGRRLYTDHHLDLIFRMKYLIEVRKFTLEGAGQQLLSDLSDKGGSSRITELSGIRSELLDMYRLLQGSKNVFKPISED